MKDLVWVEDKPTDEGWYWRRSTDSFKDSGYDVDIVYVRWYCDELCIMNWPISSNAEWAGPIPIPKEIK